MTRILLFGTFDKLHFGHINLFLQAHEHAQEIHIIVARDETVKQTKGRLPAQHEKKRLIALKQHPLITHAQLGSLGNKYEAIKEISPHVIGLGYDQKTFVDGLHIFLQEHLPDTRIVRFKPHNTQRFKSSLINDGRENLL